MATPGTSGEAPTMEQLMTALREQEAALRQEREMRAKLEQEAQTRAEELNRLQQELALPVPQREEVRRISLEAARETVGAYQQHPGALTQVKFPTPPNFEGKGHEDIGAWLFKIRQYCELTGMAAGPAWVLYAAQLLRGAAAEWWRYREETCLPGTNLRNWEAFAAEITERFTTKNQNNSDRDRLYNLQHRGDVTGFNRRFSAAALRVRTLSDEDLRHLYIRKLEPQLQRQVAVQFPNSLATAMHMAEEIEAASRTGKPRNSLPHFEGRARGQGPEPMELGRLEDNRYYSLNPQFGMQENSRGYWRNTGRPYKNGRNGPNPYWNQGRGNAWHNPPWQPTYRPSVGMRNYPRHPSLTWSPVVTTPEQGKNQGQPPWKNQKRPRVNQANQEKVVTEMSDEQIEPFQTELKWKDEAPTIGDVREDDPHYDDSSLNW